MKLTINLCKALIVKIFWPPHAPGPVDVTNVHHSDSESENWLAACTPDLLSHSFSAQWRLSFPLLHPISLSLCTVESWYVHLFNLGDMPRREPLSSQSLALLAQTLSLCFLFVPLSSSTHRVFHYLSPNDVFSQWFINRMLLSISKDTSTKCVRRYRKREEETELAKLKKRRLGRDYELRCHSDTLCWYNGHGTQLWVASWPSWFGYKCTMLHIWPVVIRTEDSNKTWLFSTYTSTV